MSHNVITVNNNKSDSSGDIPFNFSDLSDITTSSLESNQVIKHNGTNWVNSENPATGSSIEQVFSVWHNFTANYGGSSNFSTNDYMMTMRDTQTDRTYSHVDTSEAESNAATATNTVKSNVKWMESIDIKNAGTYLCIFVAPLETSSGGYVLRWHSNSGGFGAKSDIYYTNRTGSIVLGIVDASDDDIIRVVVESQTGTNGLPNSNKQHSYAYHIFRLN